MVNTTRLSSTWGTNPPLEDAMLHAKHVWKRIAFGVYANVDWDVVTGKLRVTCAQADCGGQIREHRDGYRCQKCGKTAHLGSHKVVEVEEVKHP